MSEVFSFKLEHFVIRGFNTTIFFLSPAVSNEEKALKHNKKIVKSEIACKKPLGGGQGQSNAGSSSCTASAAGTASAGASGDAEPDASSCSGRRTAPRSGTSLCPPSPSHLPPIPASHHHSQTDGQTSTGFHGLSRVPHGIIV